MSFRDVLTSDQGGLAKSSQGKYKITNKVLKVIKKDDRELLDLQKRVEELANNVNNLENDDNPKPSRSEFQKFISHNNALIQGIDNLIKK